MPINYCYDEGDSGFCYCGRALIFTDGSWLHTLTMSLYCSDTGSSKLPNGSRAVSVRYKPGTRRKAPVAA